MNVTYMVNKQLRSAWAQIACMMLVPGYEGIGALTKGVLRGGTMGWAEPQQLIDDVRWAEFVRCTRTHAEDLMDQNSLPIFF